MILPYLESRQTEHQRHNQPKPPSQRGVYLMFAIIFAIALLTYLASWALAAVNSA